MSGCFDNIQFNRPEWLDFSEKRNSIASVVAGCLVRYMIIKKYNTVELKC